MPEVERNSVDIDDYIQTRRGVIADRLPTYKKQSKKNSNLSRPL